MIRIDRSPAPPELVAAAAEELIQVRAYYDPQNVARMRSDVAAAPGQGSGARRKPARKLSNPKSFNFTAYLVAKKHLEKLFHRKCGYCETKYKAALTGDIEHYRPKGVIRDKDGRLLWPGYYWLAADWSNLIPVCKRCNSKGEDEDLGDGVVKITGKGDWFPLSDEARRAAPETDPKDEDPLLLDPCRVEPGEHLTFFEREGHRALLMGTTEHGKETIEILGLNRIDLVERRLELLLRLEALMVDVQAAQRRATRATSSELDRVEALEEMARKKAELEGFQAQDKEYAALCRHVVAPFLAAMKGIAASV